MKSDVLRQWIIVAAVVITIGLNGLANALPLNNLTTGEISDRFEVYFVPAGYVFSIWGLIYLGLLTYAGYQALPSQRDNPRLGRIRGPFLVSSAANIAWLFLWHYEYIPWTLIAMFTLLVSLILVYLRLGIGRSKVSFSEKWLVRIPFSIYLGWVTVATIANVTAVLDDANWSGWGIAPQVWAVIMLFAGAGIGGAFSFTRQDIAVNMVIVWAFVGIAVKHADTPTVAYAAWAATALTLLLMGLGLFLRGNPRKAALAM